MESEQGRRSLLEFYRTTLLEDTLPFWFPRCIDREAGGYLHCVDRDGSVVDTDKSIWAHGRMAWLMFMLSHELKTDENWPQWGEHGLEFLERHGFAENGRMYFHVDRFGKPLRQRRYAYSESFAAIAYAAHARLTGNPRSAQRANELFDFFVDWNFTPGRMPPKGTDVRPTIGLAPRMISIVTAQELRDCLSINDQHQVLIEKWIDEIGSKFWHPDRLAVMEAVSPEGQIVDHFDTRIINPGHAIEAAWFILREAEYRGREDWVSLGCAMLDAMWQRGWDRTHGGLLYFVDVDGKPVQEYWHEMKFWWPHDEALIATLYAWKLTREPRYAQWHEELRAWSFEHFADPEHGEWFGYLRPDGSLSSSLKGNLWKSCFHHPRALFWCSKLLEPIA